jgi:glycosyltransferase involved in cell wall biosynthesis
MHRPLHILTINHYAGGPTHGMEFRPFYISREWIRQGHKALVIAASYSHLRMKQPEVRWLWKKESVAGVPYLWLRTPAYSGNGVGRMINIMCFVFLLVLALPYLMLSFRPKAVIASSTYPLDIYPAFTLARLSGAKLVFEVHDLWPLTLIELGGMSSQNPGIRLFAAAEKFAYRHSDKVVSILPDTLPHMTALGLAPEKFIHIPNGIVIEDWVETNLTDLPREHARALEEVRKSGKFVVGYFGGHGLANDVGTLIEAALMLDPKKFHVVLIGDGPEKPAAVLKVNDAGVRHVTFLSTVKKSALAKVFPYVDCLWIGFQDKPIYRFGVGANKIFDYMMSGRPIVFGFGHSPNLISEAGCGVTVRPENPTALAEGIGQLAASDQADRDAMGSRGKTFVTEHHDYRVLASEFLK